MIELRVQIMLDENEATAVKEIASNLLLTNFLTDLQRKAFVKINNQIESVI